MDTCDQRTEITVLYAWEGKKDRGISGGGEIEGEGIDATILRLREQRKLEYGYHKVNGKNGRNAFIRLLSLFLSNSRIQLSPFFLPLHVSITRNNRLNVANFSKNYLFQPPFGKRSPSISVLSLSRVGEGMARNRKRRFDSAGTELVYDDFRFRTSTTSPISPRIICLRSMRSYLSEEGHRVFLLSLSLVSVKGWRATGREGSIPRARN